MPVIKPYEIKTLAASAPDVRSVSVTSSAGVGKGLEQLGGSLTTLSEALSKREQQEDVSDTHVKMSEAQANLTNEYHQQLQDGTLDVDDFKDHVQDTMDKVGDKVGTHTGQLYFNQASAELQANFLVKAAQGSAQLAGEKAKANYMTSLNNGSTTLLNDPSSFEFTQSQQTQGIDALVASGGLPAEAADKLKLHSNEELAKSAVRGWIRLDPETAKKQLDDGKWNNYIDGDLKHQLYGEVNQQNNANEANQRQKEKQIKDAHDAAQTKTQNDFLQQMQDGKLKTQDVLDSGLDAFGSGSKEQFIQMIKRQADESNDKKIKTDSSTYINLWDRVHLPDGDPNKITNENDLNSYMGRGLTVENINTLRSEMLGKKTAAGQAEGDLKKGFTDIAKGKLSKSNPLTGIRDPVGDEQYQKFLSNFSSDYSKKRQEGKSAQELLNPDSPDYMGKSITQYVRSNQQIMKDLVKSQAKVAPSVPEKAANPPTPRQPGESAANYLKRIGK